MVQAPSVPKEQPKVTPVCFRKRANCGHVHHEHPTPRKSKGTHSTLKKHPVSPPAKWKAWASPEGRNKAKCLERNKNDELSNELKDCQKEKRPPAEKHSGSWCIFFEARRVFDAPYRMWRGKETFPFCALASTCRPQLLVAWADQTEA